jgi:hypothetical protein
MTEDELIELIARALAAKKFGRQTGPFILGSEDQQLAVDAFWPDSVDDACAAITAIREALEEPTDAMIDAGDAALFNAGDEVLASQYIGAVWSAMLAASPLKGET